MEVRFSFSQVDEWQTPVAPRRRVDRGYIPPSPRNISSFQTQGPASPLPSFHQLGNLANFMQRTLPQEPIGAPGNLVSAEGELRRLCLSQGWGGPTVHLTGQRIAASGFQVHKNKMILAKSRCNKPDKLTHNILKHHPCAGTYLMSISLTLYVTV